MPCGGSGTLLEVLADGSIRVTGTTEGSTCQAFSVAVANLTVFKAASPDANGDWVLTFAGTEITGDLVTFRGNTCGRETKLAIRCDDPGSACSETTPVPVQCENDPDCPSVTFTITPGDCVDGWRTVHIVADVVSTNDATYVWFFGTDEDNQPGEDSQAGDGAGNVWLPLPNANGVRRVETDHVYEPSGAQPNEVTVNLQTSQGPSRICVASQTFTLEPCTCSLAVSLEVLNQADQAVSVDSCLPPGDYVVRVTSPTGNGIDYTWSVDGVADTSQTGATYDVAIAAGEQKTISCAVEQGGCDASNGVTIEGCGDCRGFDAALRVLDGSREVNTDRCVQPGTYTVEATAPTGAGNTRQWFVDDVLDPAATGNTIQVTVGASGQRRVVLEASRGGCRDVASVTLQPCRDEPPPDDGFIPCLLFKVLALIGLGLLLLGGILVSCPTIGLPVMPPPVVVPVGLALMGLGGVLLLLGLALWWLICQPSPCDWLAFLWQALILLGLMMIYAGFCPGCVWMLAGIVPLIVGAGLAVVWARTCEVTHCRALAEWITLFTFVVNIIAGLEAVLASCVITTQPIAATIWGLVIAGFQAWLWFEANRANCIQD